MSLCAKNLTVPATMLQPPMLTLGCSPIVSVNESSSHDKGRILLWSRQVAVYGVTGGTFTSHAFRTQSQAFNPAIECLWRRSNNRVVNPCAIYDVIYRLNTSYNLLGDPSKIFSGVLELPILVFSLVSLFPACIALRFLQLCSNFFQRLCIFGLIWRYTN
jgi:hypothetical protein